MFFLDTSIYNIYIYSMYIQKLYRMKYIITIYIIKKFKYIFDLFLFILYNKAVFLRFDSDFQNY